MAYNYYLEEKSLFKFYTNKNCTAEIPKNVGTNDK